jgi:hypothetical protein
MTAGQSRRTETARPVQESNGFPVMLDGIAGAPAGQRRPHLTPPTGDVIRSARPRGLVQIPNGLRQVAVATQHEHSPLARRQPGQARQQEVAISHLRRVIADDRPAAVGRQRVLTAAARAAPPVGDGTDRDPAALPLGIPERQILAQRR